MFNRFAICILLAGVFFGATAVAQQPKTAPSPMPKAGTPEYTEAALDGYNKAMAHYNAVCFEPLSSLEAMDAAWEDVFHAYFKFENAVNYEADASHDMIAANDAVTAAEKDLDYYKAHPEKYEQKLKAEAAYKHAQKVARDLHEKYRRNILARVNGGKELEPEKTGRHMQLSNAAFDARMKAKAEKKTQPSPSPEPKKTSCAPGSGLGGAMENVACQEQHSGSGH